MYVLAWGLVSAFALAQTPPDPRELIRQSGEALKAYPSYQLDSLSVIEMKGGNRPGNRVELPVSVSVRRPDRMRIESGNQADGMTVVSDGEHTFIYMAPLKRYIQRAASGSPDAALGQSGFMQDLPDIAKSVKSVKLTGEETIEVAAEKIPCWMVETRYGKTEMPVQGMTILEAAQTLWIAKSNHIAWRSALRARLSRPGQADPVEMTQATRTVSLKLDAALPDSLFVFTPPEGSRQIEDWTLPGVSKPAVAGRAVPEFRAKTLDGAAIDLAALRGKVVLLDFWATWCAPCRRDLPIVEKLHREFRAKGLVVVGVNVGEERDTVTKFLQTAGISYPIVLLSSDHGLVAGLSVNAFPTVVLVDRDGKVAAYEVGALGETALRARLATLGISRPLSTGGKI
jgi:thiol-disulfide isomerase/thioredoxin